SSAVPWDFFICSRLRSCRSRDEPDCEVRLCCHVYENGCMTFWRIPHGDMVEVRLVRFLPDPPRSRDLLAEPIARKDASLLVVLLLELVKEFHSCQVVHGGLKPESLYFYNSGIAALDFSNSVDLQLQTDVTTAQALPSAQKYIQQGLL
ncbi:hypothetical protein M9458_041064, partial [Cirrhinus mrigala]